MKKVSVIIPCYNSSEFIQETINSLLAQSYKNCEFIFVNDGSKDETSKIIGLNKQKDNRIVLVDKENGGVSSARNAGVKLATGDLIVFCDSDDILLNDSIEILVENINKFNADICFGTYQTFEKETPQHILRSAYDTQEMDRTSMQKELSLCKKLQNHLWGKIFRTELLKNYCFEEKHRVWEDIHELYKIIELCNQGVFINTPIVMYRLSPNSLSKQISKYVLNDFCRAQIEKANFYLSCYPKLAKYHAESMFQCGAEVLTNYAENEIELFNEFLLTYKKIIRKSGFKNRFKYFLIRHKKIYRIIFRKK